MSVMNETAIGGTKAKTAKHMTDWFGLPKYEMPKMEVPAEFREMTDKGVARARDTYAKAKVASDEAAGLLESTYATVCQGRHRLQSQAYRDRPYQHARRR